MGEAMQDQVLPQGNIHIYQVYYQKDMTEGRGGMVAGPCFTTEQLAWDYCDLHEGVMGRKPVNGWRYSGMGDWDVRAVYVRNSLPVSKEDVAAKALELLSKELTEEELKVFLEMTRN